MQVSSSPYSLLMLAGIAVSIAFWVRLAKRDERLLVIYIAALVSAFLGAKLVYLAAEGWMFWDAPERWMIWATGKTILGALLGGYAGVEVAKKLTGYTEATGDWFALIAPLAGQHFHIYLIAYGAFRFAHEFLRATPRIGRGISGYQIAALACVALGAWRFAVRARSVAGD